MGAPRARAMATCRSLLMVPVTLCFFLNVLPVPAQSKENLGIVIFYGTARCKSNTSKIISNATLHVTINGTTIAVGNTTSTGQFLMAGRVTSEDQLSTLVSKKAVITAPRQACNMPAAATAPAAPARKLVQVPRVYLGGHRILADNPDDDLVDIADIGELIHMLGDPNISNDDAIQTIVDTLSSGEAAAVLNFLEDSTELDPYGFLDEINGFLGIPPIERNPTTTNN